MHRDQAAFGLELQGPGTDLNAVGIMNVYSFFVSLSPFSLLSSAIVFVIELYGRFCVCLIHVPTCIPTEIHTQIFFFSGGDQKLSTTYHTDREQMQGVGCFSGAVLV